MWPAYTLIGVFPKPCIDQASVIPSGSKMSPFSLTFINLVILYILHSFYITYSLIVHVMSGTMLPVSLPELWALFSVCVR